ncbi:MAG: hypothetical protein ACI8PZ_006096 [Myxococcota bacterium]|jgi:hypothetical protein
MLILIPVAALATDLVVSGACPGRPELSVTDATPRSSVILATAGAPGDAVVVGGPCAGAEVGLAADDLAIAQRRTARADGSLLLRPPVEPEDCGVWMIAFDLASCTASPPAQVGAPLELRRTLYDSLGDAVLESIPGDSSATTASVEGEPAALNVALLNGIGVIGGRSDVNVDDGETVHIQFHAPAWSVSLTHTMANDLDGDGVLGAVEVTGVEDDGTVLGPVRGTMADLVDASGWLGADALVELHITAIGDSYRLASVGHLEVP